MVKDEKIQIKQRGEKTMRATHNITSDATRGNITPRVSVNQYAEAKGVSRMTIYRLIWAGKLKAERIGDQWRIPADALPMA